MPQPKSVVSGHLRSASIANKHRFRDRDHSARGGIALRQREPQGGIHAQAHVDSRCGDPVHGIIDDDSRGAIPFVGAGIRTATESIDPVEKVYCWINRWQI
jgi:hypothetical protein